MKKLLSILLVLAMLLSVLPAAVFATTEGISVNFTGDGDWIVADHQIDSTKSYVFEYDLTLPIITGTTTPNTWADTVEFVVRNAVADDYFKFSIQSFCNGSAKYQVAASAQVWNGSGWSDRPFNWSSEQDTPIDNVHVKLAYNADSGDFTWTVSNNDSGATLDSYTFSGTMVTEEIKTCTACETKFYRNSTAATVSNGVITYAVEEEETPAVTGTPVTFVGDGDWLVADHQIDSTKSYTFEYDLTLPVITGTTTPNTWADTVEFVVRNAVADDYFKFSIQSFCNGGTKYQVAVSAQVWNGSGWSDRPFNWSSEQDAPIDDVHVKLAYNADSGDFTWTVSNNDSGATLDSYTFSGTMVTEEIKTCTACETKIYRNNTATEISNVTITYEQKENESVSPAEFGWVSEDTSYSGWTADTEGAITVDGSAVQDMTLYKTLLTDPENFTLNLTVQILNHRAYIQVLGNIIEIAADGGNGNQLFDKVGWDWYNAQNQTVDITLARGNGGALSVKLLGRGNATPVIYSLDVPDASNQNLVIGVMESTGKAVFSNVTVAGVEAQSVADWGWDTDEVNGEKDFSGWLSIDGVNISANYENTANNHRIWKSLIENQENFCVRMDLDLDDATSAYVKVLGQYIELDGRGGNGQQLGIKPNGNFDRWLDAADCAASLCITRKAGGNIIVGILGADQSALVNYTLTPSETGDAVELGIYGGAAKFENIDVSSDAIPFVKAAYAGDLAGEWISGLNSDIAKYQLRAVESVTVEKDTLATSGADLVILADGLTALLAGTDADSFIAAYAEILKAVKESGVTVVVTGLPYVTDAALGEVSVEALASYNAALYELALAEGVIYADLTTAMGDAAHTVGDDGKTPNALGNALISGEILSRLMREDPCLAVNTSYNLDLDSLAATDRSEDALNAFVTAADIASLTAAVEDLALGLDLRLYRSLSGANQAAIMANVLAADRSNLADHASANLLFYTETLKISRSARVLKSGAPFTTYVAVGDSISEGACALNRTDAWVYLFAELAEAAQGSELTLINKAISGTMMSTTSGNGVFPAAKDTVQDYIVPNNPDLMTIAYGINDYHAGTTYETFISDYRGYLTEIRAALPDTVIIVFGLCAKGHNDQSSADIIAWNAGIRALAEEFGCIYADSYYDMRGREWLLADGLHPNNAGYRVVANTALRYFSANVDLSGVEEQPPVEVKTPGDFGWDNDSGDFSGWTATGEANLAVTYNEAAHNRVWNDLLKDQENFTMELDVTNDNTSSTYIRLLGVNIELDSNNGSGNQTFMKVGGVNYDWLSGNGCKFHVTISRENGGDLTVTVTGEGNETPFTATVTPTESNENVELGLYRGISRFENITVVSGEAEPTEVEIKISHTVSFDSDLQMNYRIKLEDILAAVPNYVTEGAYLTVEKDRYPMGGGAMTVETVTLYPDLTTDAERMLFNLAGIQSVEMGSELRAVLHFFDESGNEYYTTVDTYSVLDYAELCFDYYDPATDGYLFTMLIDCLNYGAAAQVAFDRRADELVNAGLEAYQQYATTELSAELTDVRTYVDNDRTITAVTAMGFTVTFADKTEINAKLTIAEGYTKEDITSVKVLNENGEEVANLTDFTELDDGRLQVTFTGVKSVNMRDMYYFVAYVGDQVASQNVGYSIEAYAKSNIASTDANAANLAKACIYYGDSAKTYFDSLIK